MTDDPGAVWRLVVRADEALKYAPNRDAADARARALSLLREADQQTARLEDRVAAAALAIQIRRRLEDLERPGEAEET